MGSIGDNALPEDGNQSRPRKRFRRVYRLGLVALLLLVVAGGMLGGVEYYTSQPSFCGSCHIMDPYYDSWHADVHADPNDGEPAACVDCHYAPGQHHTVMAKFRGLSQAASYFSGRSGAGRPKAHVADASCLNTGCHDDGEYLNAEQTIGNVQFSHAKHLDPQGTMIAEKQVQIAQTRAMLIDTLEPNRFATVESIAKSTDPTERRHERLIEWAAQQGLANLAKTLLQYDDLVHVGVRIDQLGGLKCASCHQFDSSLGKHFAVAQTTCYTCHFMSQPFNANTGRCLGCHTPPANPVPVHYGRTEGEIDRLQPTTATIIADDQSVTMDHALIVANNVDCVSCHADLIHGTGTVTRRDCQNCHDQQRYLEEFDARTVDTVQYYHSEHAATQNARCNDCHQLIKHEYHDLVHLTDAIALLSPVRDNCQHCHPDHHIEQVNLLLGRGGYAGRTVGTPNPMTGSRANCRACHTHLDADPKGDSVVTSTQAACQLCHSEDYEQLYTRWQKAIQARLDEAVALARMVHDRMAATALPEAAAAEANKLVARANGNIHLVSAANGMHNKNYSFLLLDQAIFDLEEVLKRLP